MPDVLGPARAIRSPNRGFHAIDAARPVACTPVLPIAIDDLDRDRAVTAIP